MASRERRMNVKDDYFAQRARHRSPVVAALEASAARRLNGAGARNGEGTNSAPALDDADRAAAIGEAASAKIEANDFNALETLFTGQGLALDAMFDKLARET